MEEAAPLIRSKLQRPRLPKDLIRRRRLLDALHAGLDCKLTLISGMAGAGKTTLLAQWLEECPQPSAWLSLDEHDNDRIVFLSYLCGAIRTVFPSACDDALALLNAAQTPPARVITTLLVNELEELLTAASKESGHPASGLVLALDDYHLITEPAIHEIVSALIEYAPQGIHLALATRTDPGLPLAGLRARGDMSEIRSADLRFTLEEAQAFLDGTAGSGLNPAMTRLLEDKTEGWITGLKLASLSMRTRSDDKTFLQRFKGTSSDLIKEYLIREVLDQQSPEIQGFVLRTSLVDRFCAPLCETLTGVSAPRSQEIIDGIAQANLFLVPLDEEGGWYRFHHLFRDILQHELRLHTSAADISGLHTRAGAWLAQNGNSDEALHHFLVAGDTVSAVSLVARQRYALMNGAQWARLDQFLNEFSPDVVDHDPELLTLKAWLLYQRGRFGELPSAVQKIEAALAQSVLAPETVAALQGEISAVRSVISCFAVDVEETLAYGQQALAKTPHELWIVRVAARLYMAGGLLMMNHVNSAYETVYAGFEEEGDGSNAFKATLLTTACNIHWMAADLLGLARAAEQVLALSRDPHSPQFLAWGHYHLGQARYHQDDLAAAEAHFTAVVRQPYLSYGICYVHSACGLALTHQVQGRSEQAREVIETAVAFTLETGNTTLLPVALAFQVELALMQGQIAMAGQQAARFDPVPPLSPIHGFFSPHLTLVKVWLAQNTPASRLRAAELVDKVRAFCESTHTTRFLIEALALQALLHQLEGDETLALASLERAIALAEPGGFVRLFADLGPSMARLLTQLLRKGAMVDYLTRILGAFEMKGDRPSTPVGPPSVLVEPLSPREVEVLRLLARHLTIKEIAEELVVSPSTAKTHTLNIYRKLDVHSRRQAIARARAMNIQPSD